MCSLLNGVYGARLGCESISVWVREKTPWVLIGEFIGIVSYKITTKKKKYFCINVFKNTCKLKKKNVLMYCSYFNVLLSGVITCTAFFLFRRTLVFL